MLSCVLCCLDECCVIRVSLRDNVDCLPLRFKPLRQATLPTCSEVAGDVTVFTLRLLRGSEILRFRDVPEAVNAGRHSLNYYLALLSPLISLIFEVLYLFNLCL